jgi:hypothetical protein
MREIKAPADFNFKDLALYKYLVFLAGSIEMGAAENWQERAKNLFDGCDAALLNPRRDDWDSSWAQEIENPKFREQVNWELKGLDMCDQILMYFDPKTKSPITLLELGLYATSGKLVVCCPDGFWRKGNVQIVCAKFNVPLCKTLEEAVGTLLSKK